MFITHFFYSALNHKVEYFYFIHIYLPVVCCLQAFRSQISDEGERTDGEEFQLRIDGENRLVLYDYKMYNNKCIKSYHAVVILTQRKLQNTIQVLLKVFLHKKAV